ncbi:MAG: site-specific integrase [Gammaproteobacteria bacterium]|nr:site-specific integrase [Gammaproteobacteria bacterium]
METHTVMGGKVHVYKRENSTCWQCSSYLEGKNRRVSTKEESLSKAKDFAEDWYLELRGKQRAGDLKSEKTFKDAAKRFKQEYEVLTEGQRNAKYIQTTKDRLRVHLIPFFGNLGLSKITPGMVQEYRLYRRENSRTGKPPAHSTMHQEIVALRQVLKTAVRQGWLQFVPDLSAPYKTSGKISHRAWFSPKEYKTLYTATRKRAQQSKGKRWQWSCEQLHDYVLFMANTGLRPDESARLEYRDVDIVDDEAIDDTILEIEVRGKRGVGFCKSMPGAVTPFKRLVERNKPKDMTERLFPITHRELLNTILDETKLKFDRDGHPRTAYSLRHTYICLRLMEGADIYQVAKNCRTSVEMIEKYYAVHLRNSIDTAAVNRMRERPARSSDNKTKKKSKTDSRK